MARADNSGMTNSHPDTYVWLATVSNGAMSTFKVAVAADTIDDAYEVLAQRYPDEFAFHIQPKSLALVGTADSAIASRKAD